MNREHGLADIFSNEKRVAALKATEEANRVMREQFTKNQPKPEQPFTADPDGGDGKASPPPPKKTRLKYSF